MAINKSHIFQGIELPDAYWVVNSIDYRKGLNAPNGMGASGFGAGKFNACAYVYIFKDKATRDANGTPLEERAVYFNLSSSDSADNHIKQAYDYIKQIDEFSGSKV